MLLFKKNYTDLFYKVSIALPVLFNGMTFFCMTLKSGHLPTHYLFERFVELSFGVGLLLLVMSFFEDTKSLARYIIMMILILFGVCLFFPKMAKLPAYRYKYITAQLFFQFEVLSFILVVFACAFYCMYLVQGKAGDGGLEIIFKARLYLIIGFLFFLTSQFFGSIWSLQGWGDYWVWGKMSFASVTLWFYIMYVIHNKCVGGIGYTLFEATNGILLFVMLIMYRMIWQP